MVRTKEGGSVLSFVIIGVVMIALLVGGAYIVKQQMTAPEAPVAPSPQPQPQPEEKTQPEAPKEQDKEVSSDDQQADKPQDTAPTNHSSELPHTGPAELLATTLALGLLSVVAVSYVRSRRPELSL